MIPIHKLAKLPAGQRRRKLALILAGLERARAEARDVPFDLSYALGVVSLALEDPKLEGSAHTEIARLKADAERFGEPIGDAGSAAALRLCNVTRNALLAAAGALPAEWDLIVPGAIPAAVLISTSATPPVTPIALSGESSQAALGDGATEPTLTRPFFPGVAVYAEDIRSPFNLGSIFRTAEAFGAERVIVSPLCAPPEHPRAVRSAMGCIDWLPWERLPLDALPADVPVFALETGGTPIDEFAFPDTGIVIVGSEELGVSPEALARASYGRVSIPMKGIKASINVGVAFGILMQAWTAYLCRSAAKPD
jgi:TrmH family RNA methyltransferase